MKFSTREKLHVLDLGAQNSVTYYFTHAGALCGACEGASVLLNFNLSTFRKFLHFSWSFLNVNQTSMWVYCLTEVLEDISSEDGDKRSVISASRTLDASTMYLWKVEDQSTLPSQNWRVVTCSSYLFGGISISGVIFKFWGSSNIELQEETMLSLGLKEEDDVKIPCTISEYGDSPHPVTNYDRRPASSGERRVASAGFLIFRLVDLLPERSILGLRRARTAELMQNMPEMLLAYKLLDFTSLEEEFSPAADGF
ncbi:hypothetical protein KSP40_PGU012744 [Platanthera guangdongensis]|uniref:Uncharacterized protein n=1 Tax=Platanthera guangdongensis TaxID=2320717 RepID=A0ABR2LLE2_9ASPA